MEWNGGMDYWTNWSGALDWTTGVPHPQIGCILGHAHNTKCSKPRTALSV